MKDFHYYLCRRLGGGMEINMKNNIKTTLGYIKNKNHTIKKIYDTIAEVYFFIKYKIICLNNATDNRIIVFESFIGKQYACSPKAIYNYLINDSRFKDFTFVWAFRKNKLQELKSDFTDSRTILVEYKSQKYFEYFAKGKYWITNWRIPPYMTKKQDQILIETWHGTPFKKIGIDLKIEGNVLTSQKKSHKMYLNDAKKYDYFISPSACCTSVFTSSFGLDQLHKEYILIETGYPRNDYLLNYEPQKSIEIKNKLGIPLNKKVILYAPTWRDNQYILGIGNILDIEENFFKFIEQISDDYIVILRLHYLISSKLELKSFKGKIFDCSQMDDVNLLYIISDILITDYSSVFFDYANLHKPIIFYMYDLDEYQNTVRDFYINLNELPGPILKTQEELLIAVYNIDTIEKQYSTLYQKFCDKYNYLDDGHAAERVVNTCINGNL